jgi:hypothetical protein
MTFLHIVLHYFVEMSVAKLSIPSIFPKIKKLQESGAFFEIY